MYQDLLLNSFYEHRKIKILYAKNNNLPYFGIIFDDQILCPYCEKYVNNKNFNTVKTHINTNTHIYNKNKHDKYNNKNKQL